MATRVPPCPFQFHKGITALLTPHGQQDGGLKDKRGAHLESVTKLRQWPLQSDSAGTELCISRADLEETSQQQTTNT